MFLGSAPGGQVSTEAAGFHTTHWTVVSAAQSADGPQSQEALARLCEAYWYPLYAFVRRQGASPPEAEDLTQGFFCHFLEHNSVANARPGEGKFRSFLLTCLKNFLNNERDRSRAQRRGGGRAVLPLDPGDAEARYSLEPSDLLTPEAIYERRWALAVLERAMEDLRREFCLGGKDSAFQELQGFLPGGEGSVSRAELAAKRGVGVGAIDVAIHRLRQRFGTLLREQVARTVGSEEEVDAEIRHLMAVLGR